MPPKTMKRPAAAPKASSRKAAKTNPVLTASSPAPRSKGGFSEASDGNLEARCRAAEARASEADAEIARLHERANLFEERTEKAERALSEANKQLASVQARVAHAEGRTEVLTEQAKAGVDAMDRAARAEERAAVLGDLQAKLPLLIRAVVGSISDAPGGGWGGAAAFGGGGGYGLAGRTVPIKLELEDTLQDPYSAFAESIRSRSAAPTPSAGDKRSGAGAALGKSPSARSLPDSAAKHHSKQAPASADGGNDDHGSESLVRRALGAMAAAGGGPRRKLKM